MLPIVPLLLDDFTSAEMKVDGKVRMEINKEQISLIYLRRKWKERGLYPFKYRQLHLARFLVIGWDHANKLVQED